MKRRTALERYFAKYEFHVRYLLSSSDCESIIMAELLQLADSECLALWENLRLGYTESQGHPLLRQEISGLYNNINPGDILTVVPEEGIFIVMNTILSRGDHIIVTTPAYQSLYEIAVTLGCTVTKWPLFPQNGHWVLDIEFLRKALTENTKMLIMNFPNNPTGFLPTQAFFQKLMQLVKEKDIYLFSDEMYRYLEHDETRRLPSVADIYTKGISLSGFSKAFGLPGLRIGWLTTKDRKLMEHFQVFRDYTTICSSAPSEILGIIALRNKDKIIQRNRRIIRENLHTSRNFFSKHSDIFEWLEPEAGSIAFPGLKLPMPVSVFCETAIREKNIMILPGTVFEHDGNHFRVGYGRTNLQEALNELGQLLKQLVG